MISKKLWLFAAVITTGLIGGSATAGTPPAALTVTPATVSAGDEFTVSSDVPCDGPLVVGQNTYQPGAWSTNPDEDGEWSVDFTVPASVASNPDGSPIPLVGEYEILATCYLVCPDTEVPFPGCEPVVERALAAGVQSFEYEGTLTIVAPEPAPEPEPEPTEPPAALPVAETPAFTG